MESTGWLAGDLPYAIDYPPRSTDDTHAHGYGVHLIDLHLYCDASHLYLLG